MKLVFYRDASASSKAAKAFLVQRGVEFEEVSVSVPEGSIRLRKRTQQSRIPAFEIKKSHNVPVVAGFDDFSRNILVKELGLKEPTIQQTLETY